MKIYKDHNQPIEERVKDLLNQMTLDEKIAQLGSYWSYEILENGEFSTQKASKLLNFGIGQITRPGGATGFSPKQTAKLVNEIQKFLVNKTRLGIPAFIHEECLSGYMTKGATIFPQMIGIASTWQPELCEQMTSRIRDQMKTLGIHQGLSPVVDVTRDPRWGRTEETFGEDPYLVLSMGVSYVKGLQSDNIKNGVVATLKHFVGYGVSEGGMNWAPAHIGERELREIFLLPFEAAIKEGKAKSVMNAYHELDGIPCGASKKLLRNVLREEWNFDGIVVSDYFAINSIMDYHKVASDKEQAAIKALTAGIDVELPAFDCYKEPLKKAVESGKLPITFVDDAVKNILRLKFEMGLFENPFVDLEKVPENLDLAEDRKLAYEIAVKSLVLLKNDGILPLIRDNYPIKKVAVIGPNANSARNLTGDYTYLTHLETLEQDAFGTSAMKGIEFSESELPITTIYEALKEKLIPLGIEVSYSKGCEINDKDKSYFTEAVNLAKSSDVAILVLGDKSGLTKDCTTGESRDSSTLKLPGVQLELLREIKKTNTPIILVLVTGRPYSLEWADKHVSAILEAWLPGEEGGNAIADIIIGNRIPGGKLPISFPYHAGQIPVFYNHKPSGGRSHWWGDYVDYPTKPLYPFGYGLSYTTFEYSNLEITVEETNVFISCEVKNIGQFEGEEVVQLYINDEVASVTRPVKELKGFKRINLKPNETKKITFELPIEVLAFYDENMKFVVERGDFKVLIGSSSEDIRLKGNFFIQDNIFVDETNKKFFTKICF
ncbi:MAG TPA: glycoside hydrolase family 3 N-terminal domain-containing protein [Defluviitoga tunisiensis]|nr:glycoside hydrolase family 3 N-terminal domain-containing protein [Defluviitoga tunisiensis]HOL86739.1 glycoside hydrolase family 3 N-terminal domain-containing protein [Defluviitoga tunisiensis]HPP10447.1 glycoside hydrolase family 3 N-terminal domain-containing protein [Defluviitoga tunisiensis]